MGEVTHDIYERGCATFYIDLSEILDEEVGETLSEFLCIMEMSKRQFWGLFLEKWNGFHFPKVFLTFWISSPNKVNMNNGTSSKCCHTFPNVCGKIEMPFPEFSLENMTLKPDTAPCTLHMKAPSPSWKEPLSKQRLVPQNFAGILLDLVFCKIRLFHKIAVFRKIKLFRYYTFSVFRMYSAKSS